MPGGSSSHTNPLRCAHLDGKAVNTRTGLGLEREPGSTSASATDGFDARGRAQAEQASERAAASNEHVGAEGSSVRAPAHPVREQNYV